MKKLIFAILILPSILFSQWVQQTVPTDIDMVLTVDFVNSNTGVAGGWESTSIFKGRAIYTTNAGINWFHAQIPDSSRSIVKAQFVYDNTGYIAGAYNTYYSNTFKNKINPKDLSQKLYPPTQVRKYYEHIGMTSNLESYRGMFLKTTNGGQNWFVLDNLPSNVYYLMGMCFINQNTGFVTASFSYGVTIDGILKTTNGGLSWNILISADSVSLGNIFTPDGNTIISTGWKWIYGSRTRGVMLKSSNGGGNWIEQHFQNIDSFDDVHFLNSMTGFAVGSDTTFQGVIYKTTNAGLNWDKVYTQNSGWYYYGVEFVNNTGKGLAVGGKLFQPSNNTLIISRTTDYGINWTNIFLTDTTNLLFSTCIVDHNIWFVCGGPANGLIYKTTNGGVGVKPISYEIPNNFSLHQNYPNPFNPVTNIRFDIPHSSNVKLIVYDALGREVAALVNEKLNAGSYEADWNGSGYPSGVYFYRVEADNFKKTKRMVLIK